MGWKETLDKISPQVVMQERKDPFDWKWMCTPRIPFLSTDKRAPPFFHINEEMSWGLSAVMGLQHCLAMVGGIITVPLLIAGPFDARFSATEQEYLIAAGLIVSGLLSLIQITQFRLPFGYMLGTGLISVVGSSFTFLPIARTAVGFMMREDSGNPCSTDADCGMAWAAQFGPLAGQKIPGVTNAGQCNVDSGFCKYSGQEAYGAFLGTCLVCVWLEVILSFAPPKVLKRAFPPMVTGTCVLLIGVALTGTGLKYWGGGAFCADNHYKRMRVTVGESYPGDWTAPGLYPSESPCAGGNCIPFGKPLSGVCSYSGPSYDKEKNVTMGDRTTCEQFSSLPGVFPANVDPAASYTKCTSNGQVVLPFGSPEYIGLGFSVFVMLILIEAFGSPFMRNCEIIIALIFGYFIAGVSTYTPPGSDNKLYYVTPDRINNAPGITFLWVNTFPISFYAPAVLPLLICFIVTTIETVGDITASAEASRVPTHGAVFDGRVQGGLLADGINSFLACLATTPPNTTFSQNNGVIALSRCANKRAGYCCCGFLILFGILAKISAVIASIPECVLGGLTTFLFVNIVVGGVRILSRVSYTGRNRFIVAVSLGLGIGNAIVPHWSANALFTPSTDSFTKLGQDTVVIILQTPYCIGTLLAIILHAILPEEDEALEEDLSSMEPPRQELMAPQEHSVAKDISSELPYQQGMPMPPQAFPNGMGTPAPMQMPMLPGQPAYGAPMQVAPYGGYPLQQMQAGMYPPAF
mmetsp:Transcript_4784/g.12272  ORF Transcript_4784/g.12272 Transcript_4784/m.12272 type:complete len:749 (-) Transcript_4784:296-2542(-)|eukprot:CAMPEP_0174947836 /NCGR_PEP_ID=MMETSP1355-20121228/87555_1 /TAXON_ID=464990 /ORGANISM="Hemiselmis tepida, Strain CCMP443" /LENGTH=748 /DNA_ID=CAMNT_0016195325 /DNA_START=3 /DNA_END=2249 /DNA_ORIENTATION=-